MNVLNKGMSETPEMTKKTSLPVIVGLVQITEPLMAFSNLPYAAGLLQAYVQNKAQQPNRYLFQLTQFERLAIKTAVGNWSLAHILGFSLYVWNQEYSLTLAKALKASKPETLIIFGGPQVPDHAEAFLRQHPFIDVVAHGEGETIFLQLLEAWPNNRWDDIPGISWIDQQGVFQSHDRPARIKDLDLIPSPFLSGVFDPLLSRRDVRWITSWETNRGCPFSCSFCDWGSAVASKVHRFGMERLEAELSWFGDKRIELLYCIDANFGMLPRDLEITRLMIQAKSQRQYPKVVYTQAAKNATERTYQVQKMLLEAGMNVSATLSLQSVSPAALTAIRRDNISLEAYAELQRRFRQDGVSTYTDVLVGLPGETFASFTDCIGTIIAQGQHRELRLWNTYILPNAELAAPAYRQQHAIESIQTPFLSQLQQTQRSSAQIPEYQEMLVGCSSYTREDWVKMRAFAWLTTVLYYSQALQLPMMLLHELCGVNYQTQLLAFLEAKLTNSPVLSQLRGFFIQRAREMLLGQPEYLSGPGARNGSEIWMTPHHYATVLLLQSPKLPEFFQECGVLLTQLSQAQPLPPGLLADALHLGEAMFKCQPDAHKQAPQSLLLRYNLAECHRRVLAGEPLKLEHIRPEPTRITVTRQNYDYILTDQPLSASLA